MAWRRKPRDTTVVITMSSRVSTFHLIPRIGIEFSGISQILQPRANVIYRAAAKMVPTRLASSFNKFFHHLTPTNQKKFSILPQVREASDQLKKIRHPLIPKNK